MGAEIAIRGACRRVVAFSGRAAPVRGVARGRELARAASPRDLFENASTYEVHELGGAVAGESGHLSDRHARRGLGLPPPGGRVRESQQFLTDFLVTNLAPLRSVSVSDSRLGLPLQGEGDGYCHSEEISGCKSFGIWPLSDAAQACFGTDPWPAERPVPQVSIEFDLADANAVDPAARELEQAGYELLHGAREEPWGQTVARLQSPEGAIIAISYAPVPHD